MRVQMGLHLIWSISLGLAAASLGTMAVLIVRRILTDWQARIRQARQKALRGVIFEYLEQPDEGADFVGHLTPDDVADIRDMIEDLVRTVRGPARDNLLQLINDLGGFEFFCEVLESGNDNRPSPAGAVAVNWFLPPGWGNEDHRLRAVAGLALFNDQRATKALTVGLADRSSRVRLAAAQALVDRGAEESVRRLIEYLDIGEEIRSRGMREIFRALAPRHAVELVDLLDADISDTVKTLILYGLAGMRDPLLLPAVTAQFASSSVDVRAECMRTLAMINHPRAMPTVLAGLADDSWIVRAQAAIAAGTIGIVEALPALVRQLTDDEWWVQFRAAQALARIGEAGRAILQRMAGEAGSAQEIASAVLAEVEAAG